jgi:nucleoside-diphosphate-sugar epimerase
MKVAVIGASGFVGGHVLRVLRSAGVEARAIVRNPRALLSDPDRRVADARDTYAVRHALSGCDCIVHSVVGPPDVILGTLAPVYAAAEGLGMRRIVYMSTGSVHGQAPRPGTSETSPLTLRHSIRYNIAKVRAERALRRLRERSTVELVMLRPTIVFGPGSRWVYDFAEGLLTGTAYMIDRGAGICNSIYVDNLAHAVHLALTRPGIDREVFLVSDEETVTWADLYRPIAEGLGFNFDEVASFSPPPQKTGFKPYVEALRGSRTGSAILARTPQRVKRAVRAAARRVRGAPLPPSPAPAPAERRRVGPVPTEEMITLHRCQWRLPHDKARRVLGYTAPISFEEGCRRSIEWLETEWLPARTQAVENG